MILIIVSLALLTLLGILAWQEVRYRRTRRIHAQDLQQTFHPRDAFHVIVFFKLAKGEKLLPTVRRFVDLARAGSEARLIYAGQAAFTINSNQMEPRDWDGVLLLQYPSRESYQHSCEDYRASAARGLFADSYYHAMRRNRRFGARVPRYMLTLRLRDILKGNWRVAPFRSSTEFQTFPELQAWRDRVSRLTALHEVNRSGLVVINLLKLPSPGGQEAIEAAGHGLLSRIAALGHGPLHVGRAVAIEKLARFDRVFIVSYPSARYYAAMLSSQFYASVTGFRHPGDAIRVATVPVTAQI
ncbi:MAG: hypothetical protein HRT77_16620 [Halioglobus sp.]|nr:hypothetical protein [Halioglobus sp.]